MFAKEFHIPVDYEKLCALKRRLEETHIIWPLVAGECSSKQKGLEGEKSLLYYLNVLSDSKYHIFHNLRLPHKGKYFQIDYLILCSSFALILEVKKITGDLSFDKNFNQMTVIKKNGRKRRKNPVLQANLQSRKLRSWLAEHHIPEIPIMYLFVNTNEESEILTVPGNDQLNKKIVNSEGLLDKIDQIASYFSVPSLETKELRKVSKLLLSSHTPEDPDILKEFNLSPKNLIPGAQCPRCLSFDMNYTLGTWSCTKCFHKSNDAHIQAIKDYFLLIKPTISNSELRHFLKIHSRKAAHRILNSMDLGYSGTLKGRIYFPKDTLSLHKNHNNNKK